MRVDKDVVSVPEIDGAVRRQAWPQEIEQLIAACGKLCLPILRRLLVDMVLTALAWRSRRKQDQSTVPYQAVDELVGGLLGDVLGHFEALDKVELAIERQRLCEVARQELRCRYVDRGLIDVGAVDALYILGAVLPPDRQPYAPSTPEIEDTVDGNLLGEKANDMIRRYGGGAVSRLVKAVVVRVQRTESRALPLLRGAAVQMRVVRPHEPVSDMSLVEEQIDAELQIEEAAVAELLLELALPPA